MGACDESREQRGSEGEGLNKRGERVPSPRQGGSAKDIARDETSVEVTRRLSIRINHLVRPDSLQYMANEIWKDSYVRPSERGGSVAPVFPFWETLMDQVGGQINDTLNNATLNAVAGDAHIVWAYEWLLGMAYRPQRNHYAIRDLSEDHFMAYEEFSQPLVFNLITGYLKRDDAEKVLRLIPELHDQWKAVNPEAFRDHKFCQASSRGAAELACRNG